MAMRARDVSERALLNALNRGLKFIDVGFEFRRRYFPKHRPVVTLNPRLDNPKADPFKVPIVFSSERHAVENHLQILYRRDGVPRAILIIEDVKRPEVFDDGAIKRPEHIFMNERQVHSRLN